MNTECDPDLRSTARVLRSRLRRAADSLGDDQYALTSEYAARREAQRRFSPSLAYGRHFCPPLPTARGAAVMILIHPFDGQWVIPLTVRPDHLPDHPGQVCLPGGRIEANETPEEAAQREFCEELGLDRFPVKPLGLLQSIYVFNSDFFLTPCVAVCDSQTHYEPNPDEVESVVMMPLDHLFDLDRHVVIGHTRGQVTWTARGIETQGIHIWGATAIVLAELAAILC